MTTIKERILGKTADADVSAEEAIKAHIAADTEVKALSSKQAAMRRELYELEEQLNKAARLSDDAPYKKLLTKQSELQAELERNHRALKEAGRLLTQAADDLHAAKFEDIIKQGKRFNNSRAKAAKKMQDAIAAFYEGWCEFHDNTDKLITFGGPALGANGGYGATILTRVQRVDAVTQELSRVSSPPPLDTSAMPALPGARTITLGNTKNLPSLVEEVEKANDYIIRKLSMRPSEAVKPAPAPVQQPAPKVERDPDGLDDEPVQPSGPRVNAAQVMATMGRVRMS